MKIQIIMHESFEAPAAIEDWAKIKGHQLSYTRLYAGDVFLETFDFDFLIIMGGPQSPATTKAEYPHFDAEAEIRFIQQAIALNKIVLGICLGAQFIGEALGAKFEHSPNREIGVFPVTLTEEGKKDPIFCNFPEEFAVGHWHGDMPGLTSEAKVLAESKGCPRQILRYADKIYGFQCHFEFNIEAISAMIQNNAHELREYKDFPYIETSETLLAHDYRKMNKLLFQFLDQLTTTEES